MFTRRRIRKLQEWNLLGRRRELGGGIGGAGHGGETPSGRRDARQVSADPTARGSARTGVPGFHTACPEISRNRRLEVRGRGVQGKHGGGHPSETVSCAEAPPTLGGVTERNPATFLEKGISKPGTSDKHYVLCMKEASVCAKWGGFVLYSYLLHAFKNGSITLFYGKNQHNIFSPSIIPCRITAVIKQCDFGKHEGVVMKNTVPV